jgi:proteic killer suppression protein
MIKSFEHKGLESFFQTGVKKGIVPEHSRKLARILDRLDSAIKPQDMNLPGYYLHKLTGSDKGTWAVRVSGNWRITFLFEGENAIRVDYKDYH